MNRKLIKNKRNILREFDKEKYGMDALNLRKRLADKGIETRSFFIPVHLQPIYYKKEYKNKFPISESIFKNAFYLPSSSHLKKKQQDYIIDVIKNNHKKNWLK